MSDPALEAALARQVYAASETLGEVFAERLSRPANDLDVQVLAHVVVGALLGGLHRWHGTGFSGPLRDVLDRCLDLLERGLQVEPRPRRRRPDQSRRDVARAWPST